MEPEQLNEDQKKKLFGEMGENQVERTKEIPILQLLNVDEKNIINQEATNPLQQKKQKKKKGQR